MKLRREVAAAGTPADKTGEPSAWDWLPVAVGSSATVRRWQGTDELPLAARRTWRPVEIVRSELCRDHPIPLHGHEWWQ
jgi:hypothetical protein